MALTSKLSIFYGFCLVLLLIISYRIPPADSYVKIDWISFVSVAQEDGIEWRNLKSVLERAGNEALRQRTLDWETEENKSVEP